MKKVFYLILCLLLSNLAYADGYWLELQGSGKKGDTLMIKVRYGGVNESKERYIKSGEDLNKMKDFIVTVISPAGKKSDITIQQKKDFWIGYYIPKTDGTYHVFAVDEKLPVVEREDQKQNIKPTQYLHTTYTIGKKNEQKMIMPYLNLDVNLKNKEAVISAYIDGKPVEKGTPLRVFLPDNQDIKLNTDENGKAVLPGLLKGQYLIRLDKTIEHEDIFEGKKYFAERHRCDYTLNVH
ncbi:hypothetical protein JI747_011825 [Chryseobacterium sp. RG1]|uniref:DUF4198 domain-containing protein n=1 Tax=Chryseobacterium tagetis TaxID=2801334 RepID=A0ABS8A1Y9_9FLAO|nr:hypothetical protein [Chryseobacterium tagetis]MCA6067872.1 hypothetical protein [Chryseobacterium tagetis]